VVDWLLDHYDATHAALAVVGFTSSTAILTLECEIRMDGQQRMPILSVVVLPKMPGCQCVYRMKAPVFNLYNDGSSNDMQYVDQDYLTLAELLKDLILLLPQD